MSTDSNDSGGSEITQYTEIEFDETIPPIWMVLVYNARKDFGLMQEGLLIIWDEQKITKTQLEP